MCFAVWQSVFHVEIWPDTNDMSHKDNCSAALVISFYLSFSARQKSYFGVSIPIFLNTPGRHTLYKRWDVDAN